jgi:aminopeptidase
MRRSLTIVLFAILVGLAGVSTAQTVDKEALAQRLVVQNAAVQQGDHVLITGGARDLELLENIAVNVRKHGAFPLITIESDRLTRRLFTDVPAKYDTQLPEFFAVLANYVDIVINVESNEQADLLADIAPERMQNRARAAASIGEVLRRRGVRQITLGNGLYPTTNLARQFGIGQDQLSDIFWKGVNVNYADLTATGDRLRRTLSTGTSLLITNPNGTNLRMNIAGRPVMVSDGTMSPESITRGEKTQVWLPAGEVFLTPVAGTADGKIVINHYFYQGRDIEDLTLIVKEGRITSMTAKSGFEPLRAAYATAGTGRDSLSVLDFGINPDVKIPAASRMVAWMPLGTVTLSVGNNTWAGGDNDVSFGLSLFLPGSTVSLDGKPLVENGVARF